MTIRKFILAVALLKLSAISGISATLNLTTGTNDSITRANGSSGQVTVVLGYYDNGTGILTPSGNAATDFALFIPLYTTSDVDGILSLNDTNWFGSPNGSTQVSKRVYAWVFDGANTTFGTASEYGLFFQSGRTWQNSTAGSTTFFSFTDSTNASFYTQAVYGTVNDPNGTGTAGTATYQLVPEPSTAMLGLLAGAGLVVRRRRA